MEHLPRRLRAIPERRSKGRRDADAFDLWGWAERISIVGLFCLALGYTAYITQSVLVPIVLAWVLGTILLPLVEAAVRHGVPRALAVVVVALASLVVILGIIGLLSTPLTYWIGRTTELGSLIKQKMQLLSQPMALFDEISKALAEVSGSSTQAVTVDESSSSIVRGIVSTITPIVSEFILVFFAMIFYCSTSRKSKPASCSFSRVTRHVGLSTTFLMTSRTT